MNPVQDSKEEGIQVIHHSSFFDSPGCKTKVFIAYNFKKNPNPFTSENPLYSKCFLFKKNNGSNQNLKKRFFYLTEDGVYYSKETNTTAVKKYMSYENTRVLYEIRSDVPEKKKGSKDFQFVIRFFKNFNTAEIATDEADIFSTWKRILAYKCIQHTFHEEFEVKKMIGKGSFAKVYYAIKKETKKAYAIKAFNKDILLSQSSGKESLINEVTLMKRLDHSNILKIYEVYETVHSIYLVIDLLEGGELLKRVKESPKLSHKDISKLMYNLLMALEHIHHKKIMHRDLKPENLLLKDKSNMHDIVIADFGLATRYDIPVSEIFFKRCGTPGFVAPEILNYKDGQEGFYDEKCDIFSAGAIFFVLITGKKLFPGDNCAQVLRDNKNCNIDYNSELLKNVPASAIDLLKKLLFVFPQGRFSATKALAHKYFSEFLEKEEKIQIPLHTNSEDNLTLKMMQMNLNEYNNDFSPISPTKQGSINIVMKKPILNGKTDTIAKMGTGCFNSNVLLESSPKKSIMASRFSQSNGEANIHTGFGGFSDHVGGLGLPPDLGSPKKKMSVGNELHKQALINSYNNKDAKKELDSIPDENCQIMNEWEQKKSGISKKTPVFDRHL